MVVALLLLLLLLLLVDGAAAVTTTAYSAEAVDVAICATSCSPTDSTTVQVAMIVISIFPSLPFSMVMNA